MEEARHWALNLAEEIESKLAEWNLSGQDAMRVFPQSWVHIASTAVMRNLRPHC